MKSKESYEALLRDYQQLQLRVTRFSFIEQKLINAQDQLDHELILYKRLNQYSNKALKAGNINNFLSLSVEAIVDILEVEAAIVLIENNLTGQSSVFYEGVELVSEEIISEVTTDLHSLSEIVGKSKSVIISTKRLKLLQSFTSYKEAIFHSAKDSGLHLSVYLIGLVSLQKAPFYEELDDKHETIFSLFTQQFLTVLTNFYQHQRIEDQIIKITNSEIELKKLSLIATKTKNGVIISDAKGQIEWVNESFVKTSGYTFEEIKNTQVKKLLKNAFNDVAENRKIIKALKEKKNIELTLLNQTKAGSLYHSQIEIIPVFNENKEHINFIYVIKDITNEVGFKEQILRMNSRFELISKKSQIGIWEWDRETSISTWNDILVHQYGAQRDKVCNKFFGFWLASLHPDDKPIVMENRNKILRNEIESFEQDYRIIRADNNSIRYLKTLTIGEKNNKGEVVRLVGSSVDITEEKIADEKVKALKLFYESILNNMPNKIVVFNANKEIVYFNESMLTCFPIFENHLFESIENLGVDDLHYQKVIDKMLFNIQQAVKKNEVVKYNETLLLNRHEVELLQTVLPLFSNDELEYIIVSGVEITELNKVQKALQKKNNELVKVNSELDNFVYRVSHDLRSPLLSINGLISLINYEEINPVVSEYVTLIDNSVNRMDASIQDILEYSRNSRLDVKYELVNIKEMVYEVFNDIKFLTDSQIELEYYTNDEDTFVTDKFRISTLLKNLIGNAVKYKRDLPHSFIKFYLIKNSRTITLRILDNGLGISKNSIPKVFDMFYRGSSASVGTGLGLYICKEIIDRLHGKIKLKSKIDVGTEFEITLPQKKLK